MLQQTRAALPSRLTRSSPSVFDAAVEGTVGSSPPAMTAFVGILAQATCPTGPSEGYEFVVSEAAAAKGCVLLCYCVVSVRAL